MKLAVVVPWDALAEAYHTRMSTGQGRPAKPARLVIGGALIIKHKLNLSDEETVQQIRENHYLQYFCGFGEYVDEPPFVPSLFVEIRKRMGEDVFAAFEQAIVDQAICMQKKKPASGKASNNDSDRQSSTASGYDCCPKARDLRTPYREL